MGERSVITIWLYIDVKHEKNVIYVKSFTQGEVEHKSYTKGMATYKRELHIRRNFI